MSQIDFSQLMGSALALRQASPTAPARGVLDAVMLVPPGSSVKLSPALRQEVAWLGPRTAWAELLREAFAPEMEPGDLLLLDDPDEEVRAVMSELWARTVVKRFRRCYLGWAG